MPKEKGKQSKNSPYKTGAKIDRIEERDKDSNSNNNDNNKSENKHSKDDDD